MIITLLHNVSNCLYGSIKGCCKHKWILFLRKMVDRCPVDMLSMQDIDGHTPYDCLTRNSSLSQEEKWYEEVLEILKPR